MSRTQGQGSATRQPASTTTRRLTAAAVRFAALFAALFLAAGAAAATGLGMLAGPLAGPAGAHARLDGSHPSNGQKLEHLPHHVSVTLDAKPATLEGDPLAVYAPGGERIDTGQPWLEDDHETIGILLDPEAAGPKGDYELLYRVVSSDNHVISGRVAFTTRAAGPPEAGRTPEGAETESGGTPRGAGAGPGDGGEAAESSPVTQPAGVTTTIAPDDPHAEHLAASQASEPSQAVDDERPFMHGFDTDIRPRLAAVAIIVLLAFGAARRAVRRDGREARGFARGEAREGPAGPTGGRSRSSASYGSGPSVPSGPSGPLGVSGRRPGAAGGFGGARHPAGMPATSGPVPAFRAGGGGRDDLAAGWGDDPGPGPDGPGGRHEPTRAAAVDRVQGRPGDEPTPADAAAARAGHLWSSLSGDDGWDAEVTAGLARFDDADEPDDGVEDLDDVHRDDAFGAGRDAVAARPGDDADGLEPQTFSWAPWAPASDLTTPHHLAPQYPPEVEPEAEAAARSTDGRPPRRRVDGPVTPPGGESQAPEAEFEDFWMEADRRLTSRVERRAAARLTPPRGTPLARVVPTSFFAASGEAAATDAPATDAPAAPAPVPAPAGGASSPGPAHPWPPSRGAVDGPPAAGPGAASRLPAVPSGWADADGRPHAGLPGRPGRYGPPVPPAGFGEAQGGGEPTLPPEDAAPAARRRPGDPAASPARRETRPERREATDAAGATSADERAARRRSPAPWYRTDELPAVVTPTGEEPAVPPSPPAAAGPYARPSGDVPAVGSDAVAPAPATPSFPAASGEYPLAADGGSVGLPPVYWPDAQGDDVRRSAPSATRPPFAARPTPAPPQPAPPLPRRVRDDGPPAPPPLPRRRARVAGGAASSRPAANVPEPRDEAAPGPRPRPGGAAGAADAAPAFSVPPDPAAPAREPLAGATPLGRRHARGRPSVAPELTGPGGVTGPCSLEIPAVEWADDPLVSAYVGDVAPAAGSTRTSANGGSWDEADRLAEKEDERPRTDRPARR